MSWLVIYCQTLCFGTYFVKEVLFENGELAAYTDDTLQKVWHFNTGAGVKAPFNSYAVNGKQYLSIVVAGRLQTSARDEIPVRGWMSTLFVFSL